MITEESIRQRLAADKVKPCRTATWEEVEFLLDRLATEREDKMLVNEANQLLLDHLEGQEAEVKKLKQQMADCRKGIVRWDR